MFVKTKQKLCENVPKRPINKFKLQTKNNLKIKLLQIIYNVKRTFTRRNTLPCKKENLTCFERMKLLYSIVQTLEPLPEGLPGAPKF